MDSDFLDKFTWFGDVRTPRIISTDTGFPRSVKAVRSMQNAPHTTETDDDASDVSRMMPYYLGTTIEGVANCENMRYDVSGYGLGVPVRPRAGSGYIPHTCS